MSNFLIMLFSKYQCGLQKSFSMQQCLSAVLENWKKSVDDGKAFGTLLMDLRLSVALIMNCSLLD